MTRLSLVVILVAAGAGRAEAARGMGAAGAVLARLPVGARGMAMGGAHGTLPGSPEVLLANPAALTEVEGISGELTYHQGIEDVSYNGLLAAAPLSSRIAVGLGVTALSAGEIVAYDYVGNRHSAALQEDRLTTGSLAGRWGALSFGASIKFLSSVVIETANSSALLTDVGWGLKIPLGRGRGGRWGDGKDRLYLGLSVSNLSDSLQYDSPTGGADQPPTRVKFGAALSTALNDRQEGLLAAAVEVPRATGIPEAHGGVEIDWPTRRFDLLTRAGVRFRRDGGSLAAGLGVRFHGAELNYAFVGADSPFGSTHHVSLGYDLARSKRFKAERTPE